MTSVAVVYHSGFGRTAAVAASVAAGAGEVAGVSAALVDVTTLGGGVEGSGWGVLHAADAIVLGCPTYMGTVSAPFKAFMDATGAFWAQQRWADKLAAGFTNAGGLSGDKLATLQALAGFAAQQGMVWVSQGVFPAGGGINRMGSWLGLMAQSDDGPASVTPPPEDHATARLFGAWVARAAVRWRAGAQALQGGSR